HSSWRARGDLPAYLGQSGVPGIAEIDTRRLTRLLRENGAQSGCLMAGDIDADKALAQARAFPGLAGMDLAKVVTTLQPYEWTDGVWQLGEGCKPTQDARLHVVAYDYGIKHNTLRMLAARGSRITVVPARTPAREVLKMKPDGVYL